MSSNQLPQNKDHNDQEMYDSETVLPGEIVAEACAQPAQPTQMYAQQNQNGQIPYPQPQQSGTQPMQYGQPPYYQQAQPVMQPYVQYIQVQPPPPAKTNGTGTAGFVFAVLGLFLGWIPVVGWLITGLGALLSFVGIFMQPRGLAVAGFIISFFGVILIVFVFSGMAVLNFLF